MGKDSGNVWRQNAFKNMMKCLQKECVCSPLQVALIPVLYTHCKQVLNMHKDFMYAIEQNVSTFKPICSSIMEVFISVYYFE